MEGILFLIGKNVLFSIQMDDKDITGGKEVHSFEMGSRLGREVEANGSWEPTG